MSTGKSQPPFYLLAGKESFLKNEFLTSLRQKLFPEGGSGLNSQEFNAEKNVPSEIFDYVNTAPFGADWRLAVVRNIEALDKDEREIFLSAAKKTPATAVLVLESSESAKKDPFLRKLSEAGKLESCHTPFERDWPGWALARAKKLGLTLDRDAVSYLILCSGGELSVLASQLEQLALFIHPRTQVTFTDAHNLLKEKPGSDVFGLADLILDRKPGKALRTLRGLFEEGVRAPEIVASLAGQIERLKKANERMSQGARLEDIGMELRIPSFFQGAFFSRLKGMPAGRLQKLAENLLECDESFKSGQATERLALEKFILSA